MSEHQVERSRHLSETERLDEQPPVTDLPAPATAHEAPKLLLGGPFSPLGLLLEGAEGPKIALSVHDLLNGVGAKRADKLVLQIGDAHVEAQPFHLWTREVGAEARPLEPALEVAFLSGIAESCQPDVDPLGAEEIQEASDALCTSHCHDRNALSVEVPTTACSQRFERDLIADPFHKHDRACEGSLSGL